VEIDSMKLEAAARGLGLRMVVLFGSRATGSPPPTPESDLDVAVLGTRAEPPPSFWSIHRALAEAFGDFDLDLVLLHDADPLLRYEVMRRGKLLHGDPDDFLGYRAFAFRDFVDSADLRDLEDRLFRKKMEYIRAEVHGSR
jgi:predicted nucleotidyltransferase